MAFPNFENKHQNDAFFSPKDFLNYLQQINALPEFEIPEALILCYQNSLAQYIEKNEEITQVNNSFTRMWLLNSTGNKVGVCANFGIGAPAAAIILEEMVALGVKKFISIGTAGSLQNSSDIGDIIVCNKAIRDEGVSHHYLASDKYAYPSPVLTDRLKSELTKNDLAYTEGVSWTIDAIYRETVAEARHYQAEGVITVEMEASALMAVAQYREVDLACAFVISDSLAELVVSLELIDK
ncbi:MAG: hypothetical protein BGO39_15470 [Chloroflexi bacterium 54-19]|nr:MAG: hypothetical protein BGO39_15470 [Chloroflexi bacterium 54-19]